MISRFMSWAFGTKSKWQDMEINLSLKEKQIALIRSDLGDAVLKMNIAQEKYFVASSKLAEANLLIHKQEKTDKDRNKEMQELRQTVELQLATIQALNARLEIMKSERNKQSSDSLQCNKAQPRYRRGRY